MTNRDKLVEIMLRYPRALCDHCGDDNWLEANAQQFANHLIAKGVTVREMIPITEEVPDGNCLAVNKRGAYTVGKIVKDPYLSAVTGYSCMCDGMGIANVTHWMPLPKPTKEE